MMSKAACVSPQSFRTLPEALLTVLCAVILPTVTARAEAPPAPCRVDVIDAANGWPVPLVELRTTHQLRFVTDNNGLIALDAPELFGRETWFFVEGHGYEVPKDGFGYRGVRLTPEPGGRLTVKVHRRLPARRLGRITGGGLFAESWKLGLEKQWEDQGILGCDSIQTARYKGQLFLAWGDTTLARYPLGLFHMLGARIEDQPLPSQRPPVRIRYTYFRDDKSVPRNIAQMPGSGPTWLDGFIALPDRDGNERLVAHYAKIEPPLTLYESGLCVWDDESENFKQHRVLWKKNDEGTEPPTAPGGHPVRWKDPAGEEWILFGDPFPTLRCPPRFEAWEDRDQWIAHEPQQTVPVAGTDQTVRPHRGSIAWNGYRDKWIVIFTQFGGESSPLGEVWYAEAPSPFGPWENAIHIVTHQNYTFYNPLIRSGWSDDEAVTLFEGTYSKTFAENPYPTARYDYNQILYSLDLRELFPPDEDGSQRRRPQ